MASSRITLPGTITSGKLQCDRQALTNLIATLPDGPVRVSVFVPCSDAQRGYYFQVVVGYLAEHIGDDKDGTHEALKLALNGGRSTTELDHAEFGRYLDRCLHHCATWHHLVIPDPIQAGYPEAQK